MRVSAISFGAWAIGGFWGEVGRRRRCARCTRRSTAASTSSTRRTSTATAAASASSRGSGASGRASRSASPPRPAAGCPTQTCEGYSTREPDGVGRAQPAATSRPTRSTCSSSTARRPALYDRPEVFGILDDLVARRQAALLRRQRRDGGRGAARDARIRTSRAIQIIFNMFRLKPAEQRLPGGDGEAGRHPRPRAAGQRAAHAGSCVAIPSFAPDDHRNFNRDGQLFDKGETFSGVPYEVGSRGGRRGCARWCRRARRWHSSRCAGF